MTTQATKQTRLEQEALAEAAGRIKALARSAGAPMVGMASVEAINEYAPPGTQPTDILPEARTVVTVGVESSPGGAWHTPDPRLMGIVSNNRLSKAKDIAYKIAEFIETEFGYYAMPYGTYALGSGGWDPVLSFKLCAELAGIGSRSLAGGMILNEKHGFPYIGLCLTSMPLPADGPSQEDVCPTLPASRCGSSMGPPPASISAPCVCPVLLMRTVRSSTGLMIATAVPLGPTIPGPACSICWPR